MKPLWAHRCRWLPASRLRRTPGLPDSDPASRLTGPRAGRLVNPVQAQEARTGNARARKVPAQLTGDEHYQLRYERVAGTGIPKAKAGVCTRLPPPRDGGRRASRAGKVPAPAREILDLAARLGSGGVQLAVMEPAPEAALVPYAGEGPGRSNMTEGTGPLKAAGLTIRSRCRASHYSPLCDRMTTLRHISDISTRRCCAFRAPLSLLGSDWPNAHSMPPPSRL